MKTEKEIMQKIHEVQDSFFEESSNAYSLRIIRVQMNVLKWVLGKQEWAKNLFLKPHHGARLGKKSSIEGNN